MPKLTLSADRDTIEKAKQIAAHRGTSVSAMFSQFISGLNGPRTDRGKPAPITRRTRGLGKASPDKTDRELFEDSALTAMGREKK